MRDQASQAYKTAGKVTFLCIVIFLLANWKTNDSAMVFQEINKRTANRNCIRTIKVLTECKMSKYSHYGQSVLFSFYLRITTWSLTSRVWHFLYRSIKLSECFKPIILIHLAITTYIPTDGLRVSSHTDLPRGKRTLCQQTTDLSVSASFLKQILKYLVGYILHRFSLLVVWSSLSTISITFFKHPGALRDFCISFPYFESYRLNQSPIFVL
jgi:hypothetical protein